MARRFRLLIGAAAGVAAGVAIASLGGSDATTFLAGWNLGALVYLVLSWRLILAADPHEVRRRAAEEDESRFGLLAIVIGAIVASLAAIVMMLIQAKAGPGWERMAAPALAFLTLVVSWLVLQTVFVLHYAHRHFGDRNRDGAGDGGFDFPGEPASTYRDFVYLSLCIGATFQVSDPQVTRSVLRNLVAAHSAVAYFYNTAILAVGINIVAGLIGR
jgi:uncharacterized membrane protein